MAPDPLVKRLRFLMLTMMALDFTLTLAGQPKIYWTDASQIHEGNQLVAALMRRGPFVVVGGWILYAAMASGITVLRQPIGSVAAMTFAVAHFCGASGWIVYRFHLGMTGLYAISLLFGAAIVLIHRRSKLGHQPPALTPTSVADAPVAPQSGAGHH